MRSAKIIQIKDFLGKPRKRGRTSLPDKYALWLQITVDDEGVENIEYDITDDKLFNTKGGKLLLGRHLASVLLDLCSGDDPELVVALQEILEGE